jgi:catechol 2,3-dioxygenase-like lactoylglutathione lyase family enzyme
MKKFLTALVCTIGWCIAAGQEVRQLPSVSMTVSSLEKVLPFYTEVLGFRHVETYVWSGTDLQRLTGLSGRGLRAEVAVLQVGNEQIELIAFTGSTYQRPIPPDARSNDLWFQHIALVVSDIDSAYRRLRQYKVEHVSTAPQTLPAYLQAAAGIRAFYFRDPDGHVLELIWFPPGKGNPRWQAPTGQLVSGIDHTAIGIQDTDASLAYYHQLLGLTVSGHSENYGPEQEHLNQVFGAHLLITGLKAAEGVGLEFLDYLAPPGGRPYPADSRPTDLWHWHTSLQVTQLDTFYQRLQQAHYPIVSSGIVLIPIAGQRHVRAFMARDVDGHAILFFE